MTKEIGLENLGTYIKALHCEIRWVLIDILRDGPKSSEEIFNHLKSVSKDINGDTECHGMCGKGDFKNLKMPSLYYHLRELENVGIIKSDYKPSESKRAPEKVWKLNIEKLTINLK
jgi:DNA-binding PadR family transcriptional regulator